MSHHQNGRKEKARLDAVPVIWRNQSSLVFAVSQNIAPASEPSALTMVTGRTVKYDRSVSSQVRNRSRVCDAPYPASTPCQPNCGMNSAPERNRWPGSMGRWMVSSGMNRLLGRKGIRLPMGLANSMSRADIAYVDNSRTPRPQGGKRDPIENCSGPATLIGPTGPENDQFLIFFSLSQMVTSPCWAPGGVLTTTLRSFKGSKKPVALSLASDLRSNVSSSGAPSRSRRDRRNTTSLKE